MLYLYSLALLNATLTVFKRPKTDRSCFCWITLLLMSRMVLCWSTFSSSFFRPTARRRSSQWMPVSSRLSNATGERGNHNIYKIDQLTAMQWSKAAWEEVSSATVANFLRHTSLYEEEPQLEVNGEEQGVKHELLDAMRRLRLRISMEMNNLLHPVEEVDTAHLELTRQ